MNRDDALKRLTAARSGHLATVRPDGGPHVVVVTFAIIDDLAVTAIDHKPKTTERLQRLANIEANPVASLLADHYDDVDWANLWWVRADGAGAIHEEGATRARAVEALTAKYSQYHDRPPQGPVISVSMDRVTWWSSTP